MQSEAVDFVILSMLYFFSKLSSDIRIIFDNFCFLFHFPPYAKKNKKENILKTLISLKAFALLHCKVQLDQEKLRLATILQTSEFSFLNLQLYTKFFLQVLLGLVLTPEKYNRCDYQSFHLPKLFGFIINIALKFDYF